MPPESLPSHALSWAARSLSFAQRRCTCEQVILGPLQNQHLSSWGFRTPLRKAAER